MSELHGEFGLRAYLEASRSNYEACLDSIEYLHVIEDYDVDINFQFVKFDANGLPKFKDLANCLADHVVEYCLSMRRRGSPQNAHEFSKLNREARSLLRKMTTGGESGEMLLYFLLETVFDAPQIVAKMDLKTNPRMEVHGSDGIHMKWDEGDGVLDIYFGESKLEANISGALTNAFNSINEFHRNGLLDHEVGLVTSHFKHLDERSKDSILSYLDRQNSSRNCRINHACLIGYDWDRYLDLSQPATRRAFVQNFQSEYMQDLPRICNLLNRRFGSLNRPELRFVVFFLPFKSVQEFRNAFNESVS